MKISYSLSLSEEHLFECNGYVVALQKYTQRKYRHRQKGYINGRIKEIEIEQIDNLVLVGRTYWQFVGITYNGC